MVTVKNNINSEFKNNAYESIQNTADKADQEWDAIAEEYHNAMNIFAYFNQLKTKAYALYRKAQLGTNQSAFVSAKAKYISVCNSYTEYDNRTNSLNRSLLSSIFRAGKFGNMAIIARSTIS